MGSRKIQGVVCFAFRTAQGVTVEHMSVKQIVEYEIKLKRKRLSLCFVSKKETLRLLEPLHFQ